MFKKKHKENITIDFGAKQYCAKGGELCSNAYNYFYNNTEHFVMILSDGMGTNERAAVESKMATNLMTEFVKSGSEYNHALETINSSLLSKSFDESLATVDIASIDLYTGLTELYKAGSAPSVVRQNGRAKTIESTSLPAGILHSIGFDITRLNCKVGDIVVMMSDGATNEGCDWIKEEIISFNNGKAQDLAERLCMRAYQQKNENCEDDITILCAILNKAV